MKKALICVGSPLQAICAVEAISEYKVSNYDMHVIDDGTRLNQIQDYLDRKGVKYSVIPYHVSFWRNLSRMIEVINPFKGRYDLLLMGDYRLSGNRMEYVPLIKSGGKIVYFDDGTYIMGWATGLLVETTTTIIRNRIMDVVCSIRRISYKNLFTIFASDITMHGYSVRENSLSHLQLSSITIGNDIYFIGTNPLGPNGYCSYMGLDYDHYLKILEKILSEIRECSPHAHIIYVPHGRDRSKEAISICNQLNIEYKKIPVCIELYMLSIENSPKEIWGFGSTALYTLRRLYKGTKISNIVIQGNNSRSFEEYCELSRIYNRNNIETIFVRK